MKPLGWFPLTWKKCACVYIHTYTYAHTHTHTCITLIRVPGSEKSTSVDARFRKFHKCCKPSEALSFLCWFNGLNVLPCCSPLNRSSGQLKTHLKQAPWTLKPYTMAALLEPGLFSWNIWLQHLKMNNLIISSVSENHAFFQKMPALQGWQELLSRHILSLATPSLKHHPAKPNSPA